MGLQEADHEWAWKAEEERGRGERPALARFLRMLSSHNLRSELEAGACAKSSPRMQMRPHPRNLQGRIDAGDRPKYTRQKENPGQGKRGDDSLG